MPESDMATCEIRGSSQSFRLSAAAYFGCVALVTALGLSVAVFLQPFWAHSAAEWLGLVKPILASPDSFYSVRVAPLLAERCDGCHGPRRQKGMLRLDSYAAIMRGGKHGAALQPGQLTASEIVTRITLSTSND